MGEVGRLAVAETAPQFAAAGAQQVVEAGLLPFVRRLTVAGRAVFDLPLVLGAVMAPEEGAAFVDRMQRIDEGQGATEIETGFATQRSEERRVGKECVSTCRSRWSPST